MDAGPRQAESGTQDGARQRRESDRSDRAVGVKASFWDSLALARVRTTALLEHKDGVEAARPIKLEPADFFWDVELLLSDRVAMGPQGT